MKHVFTINNLADDRCFLCGDQLIETNRTDEHIFPVWLLHRVGLWNQSIVLLNQTEIPYRLLKIPCCSECNNEHLGRLEDEIQAAFLAGYDAVSALPTMRLFQWCAKIWYGLLFRELRLRADRQDATLGSIMTAEGLEEFQTHHIFLQSIRLPWLFHEFMPASIFVVKTHQYENPSLNFEYIDNVLTVDGDDVIRAPLLAIRCEGAAVICVFEDLGLTKQCVEGLQFTDGQALHPFQFIEIACIVVCQHSLRRFPTRFSTERIGDTDGYRTRVTEIPEGELWGAWNQERFKAVFQKYMGRIDEHPLRFDLPGLTPSVLVKDGQRIVMNQDGSGHLQPMLRPSPLVLPRELQSRIFLPPSLEL